MEDLKKEESCQQAEASWGVQTASSAARIFPSVFQAAGTVMGQRIVSTEVTNHHHVQLPPAGLDNSDVFIQESV
jgi:hypothetical protein